MRVSWHRHTWGWVIPVLRLVRKERHTNMFVRMRNCHITSSIDYNNKSHNELLLGACRACLGRAQRDDSTVHE